MLPTVSSAPSSSFLPALTGIRAVAALFVLALHADQMLNNKIAAHLPLLLRGYLGVDFFFLLSGFIITHVYQARLARPDKNVILIFLWHRIIRLYPVHLTILAALLLIAYVATANGVVFNNPQAWRTEDLFWHLTLLHAWGTVDTAGWNPPSWSISAEWFAYLMFPLIAVGLRFVRNPLLALLIAIVVLGATSAAFAITKWSLAQSWLGAPALVRVSGEFLIGAFLCRALASRVSHALPSWVGNWGGATALVLFFIGASYEAPDFVLVALLAVTILGAATAQGFLENTLGGRPMVWLGEVSYSIYMVHLPVLIILRRLLVAFGYQTWSETAYMLAFSGMVGLVIGVATILFYSVEHPVRTRLRDSLGILAPA
jgi:peptidoglycan/LPS O-acetylase OafA/YrhL